MSRRAPETLADYLTAAIAPALIMTLLGSLVFFLVGVFYQGEYPLRLTWVLGLFVLAIVCVSRISMEEGGSYAMLFGLPLALVVGLAVARFVEIQGPLAPFSLPINWGLMALTWWCAHKLTWDCTLNDERRDTSGQGLLRSMGWDRVRLPGLAEADQNQTDAANAAAAPVAAIEQYPPHLWWKRWLGNARPPAAHGKWVVYFSVAALPLFGLGQAFLPVDDTAGRRFAYWMLIVYVASALGLLLTTSFLGLRRYIHQRRLVMPVEMTAVWLGLGVAMIVGLLIAASLLPRPAAEYSLSRSLSERLGRFASAQRSSSEIALGPEGTKDSQSQNPTAAPSEEQAAQAAGEPSSGKNDEQKSAKSGPGGKSSQQGGAGGQQQNQTKTGSNEQQTEQSGQQPGGEKQGTGGAAGQHSSKGGPQSAGKQTSDDKQAGGKEPSSGEKSSGGNGGEKASGSGEHAQPAQSPPQAAGPRAPRPNVGGLLALLLQALRWLFYVAVAVVVAWLAWKYREQLRAAWLQLMRELRDLWNSLFKSKTTAADAPSAAMAPSKRLPRFEDFADPFTNGQFRTTPLPQLVGYTFAALEAWSRDNAAPRAPEQTPLEYAESLSAGAPQLGESARHLIDIYSRLAYARQAPPANTIAVLQSLWQAMRGAVKPLAAV